MIKVHSVDDHPLLREGIAALVNAEMRHEAGRGIDSASGRSKITGERIRPYNINVNSFMNSSFPQPARWVSTLLVVMAAATASAQTSGGAIRGTVSDPTGASVPGAGITIEEISTSGNWWLVSSSAGLYNAPNLPVGRYNLTVKAPGFSTAECTNIDVSTGPGREGIRFGNMAGRPAPWSPHAACRRPFACGVGNRRLVRKRVRRRIPDSCAIILDPAFQEQASGASLTLS
jgi:Carboxypeptidase regulatory-like domain